MKQLMLFVFFCMLMMTSAADEVTNNEIENEVSLNLSSQVLTPEEIKDAAEQKLQKNILASLESTQLALVEKLKEQKALQRQLKVSNVIQKAELQGELDKISVEIKSLKRSFEQLAIGGVQLNTLSDIEEKFNWKAEFVLIIQPLFESLKGLTEKPRNLERFRSEIKDRQVRDLEISKAIDTLEENLAGKPPRVIISSLKEALEDWQSKQKDNLREIESAQVQLDSLLGNNTPWYDTLAKVMQSFVSGRGKTILIALLVAGIIWQSMKSLLWLLRKRSHGKEATKQRIIVYCFKFLTTLMIIIAITIVFYTRSDLLLLALMIVIVIGLSFAVRSYVPRYILEVKTLLDLGTVREDELVVYNGIPWQVHHINVQSILRNPDIYGVLRVPLSELVNLKSRPAGRDENWFPCRKGDLLLMPNSDLAEVLRLTPDNVELQTKGGMCFSYPSVAVIEMGFYNLTRGDRYGVTSVFGIDYEHIKISLDVVPECFQHAVEDGLRHAGLGEHVLDVLVDFKEANSSSLDYLIYVTMHSRAASSYFKIGRIAQQSCVKACADNNWGIPFPQMAVHHVNS